MTDRELMQMALDLIEPLAGRTAEVAQKIEDAIKALRNRLAQPEPEPVAIGEEWKPCVKLPIVVHVREQRKGETHVSTREGITKRKHEWVGLTDEEVKKIVDLNTEDDYGYDIWCNGRAVARDVEAKLKEKNT